MNAFGEVRLKIWIEELPYVIDLDKVWFWGYKFCVVNQIQCLVR
jgi:hypothetical protein